MPVVSVHRGTAGPRTHTQDSLAGSTKTRSIRNEDWLLYIGRCMNVRSLLVQGNGVVILAALR